MATKPLPSQEVLRQLLDYDPDTGKLFWKERGPEWFEDSKYDADRVAHWWNARFAGKEAFCTFDAKGYPYGFIMNRRVAKHRVVWCLINGEIIGEIDHIDGDPSHDKIENLRDVTRQANMRNKRTYSRNTSGFRGVYWAKAQNKWRVALSVGGKERHCGYFEKFEDAVAARKKAEKEMGFHKNHGRAV